VSDSLGHGRRLTREEYDRAIVALYESVQDQGIVRPADTGLRRAELDLNIDLRLGVDFPADRRERMWGIQQRIEERRIRLLARSLFGRMLPWVRRTRVDGLVEALLSEYSQVLTGEEMRAYFPNRFPAH